MDEGLTRGASSGDHTNVLQKIQHIQEAVNKNDLKYFIMIKRQPVVF